MDLSNLKIISAGAGSGKTYRLTQELVQLVRSGQVRATGIIATTFTRKAAAELQERVRVKLLDEGLSAQADELANALIGTVHGLGVKLLRRFAFEAGVSPQVDILPDGDQQRLFNQSLAASLSMDVIEDMDQRVERLGLNARDMQSPFDWRKQVRELVDLARANDFSFDDLRRSAQRSWESLAAFLPPANPTFTASYLYPRLAEVLDQTCNTLEDGDDSTKKTQDVVLVLREAQRDLRLRGHLPWRQWAKLGKLDPAVRSRELMEPLRQLVWQHQAMPEFQLDLQGYIQQLFTTAEGAMREYQRYKQQRGLIDYTDMEVLVSRLLDQAPVQEVLRDEIDLLLVDEFQDTNPIQLTIFLKLSHIANRSIWVGDPKQSIYGFRGAEPRLMQAIIDAAGGIRPENIQTQSWRSRPELVWMANALFTRAFSHLPPAQVALQPQRSDGPGQGAAILHWHFVVDDEKRQPAQPWTEECLARALHEWLAGSPLVQPKGQPTLRPARPGDVAILCRNNSDCTRMADALHRAGLRASLARAGLLATAEACLVLACLKYLLNEEDSLSNAEVQLLASRRPLAEIVEDRLDYLARNPNESRYFPERWGEQDTFISQLNALRPAAAQLSSAELLNLALEALDLRRIIVAWGNAEQRLGNIDQLRSLALQYEENCNNLHAAASLGGFLLWLGQTAARGEDYQAAEEAPDAVNVLTYHRSKGLEWPVVAAHNLDQNLRAEPWGFELVPESDHIDLSQVLAGRWLRFWVNPYADQLRGTPLWEQLQTSTWQSSLRQQALAEEARLLYVGLTRARDYQIFPTTAKPTAWLNRVWNQGDEGIPTLDPLTHESAWHWDTHFLDKNTRTYVFPRVFPVAEPPLAATPFLTPRAGVREHPLRALDPAAAAAELGLAFGAGPTSVYAPPLPLANPTSAIGDALKKYLVAAYHPTLSDSHRQQLADGLLGRFPDLDAFGPGTDGPAALEQLASAWQQWLAGQWPGAHIATGLPLRYPYRGQVFTAILNWVLDTPAGWVIIQDSNFSGEDLRRKTAELGAFLHLAGRALVAARGGQMAGMWVHFVLQGKVVAVQP